MIDPKIWEDQAEFNRQVHGDPPTTHAERARLTRDFVTDMQTEITEFLTAGRVVGSHRQPDEQLLINEENVRRQLIDMFKYWMILCQVWGFSPEQMEETYWRKTATVKQRYTAEWLTKLDGPVVLLDLDGVLADYLEGLIAWISNSVRHGVWFPNENSILAKLAVIRSTREFVNAESLGISIPEWEALNHQFRAGGGFGRLPLMPYVQDFVSWCHNRYNVVAITSRAIDKYPNIYDDTVHWFARHGLHVDKIWWGVNKAEKLAAVKHLIPDVRFAIDDDPRYVDQFAQYGIKRVYWYKQGHPIAPGGINDKFDIVIVNNLREVMQWEEKR